ncbi:TPA: HaeII family restriction endonuclease [Neisseria gonorrhoeae]
MTLEEQQAKEALDGIIKKSRVHLYKPIQIAEILYHDRCIKQLDFLNLDTLTATNLNAGGMKSAVGF